MKHYRLRLPLDTWKAIHADLARPHEFAHERMGVLACKLSHAGESGTLLLPTEYLALSDTDYVASKTDPSVLLGVTGISHAMSFAYNTKLTCLYVHVHAHKGSPRMSPPDLRHGQTMVADLLKANRRVPQGFFVLSLNAATGLISSDGKTFRELVVPISLYGRKMVIH